MAVWRLAVLLAITWQVTAGKSTTTKASIADSFTATTSNEWGIKTAYENSNCSDVPVFVFMEDVCETSKGLCYQDSSREEWAHAHISEYEANASITRYEDECTEDKESYLTEVFGDSVYLRIDFYGKPDCSDSNYSYSTIYRADGKCHSRLVGDESSISIRAFITTIQDDGSMVMTQFSTGNCSDVPDEVLDVSVRDFTTGECNGSLVFSTNAQLPGVSSGSTSQDASASPNIGRTSFVQLMVLIALLATHLC